MRLIGKAALAAALLSLMPPALAAQKPRPLFASDTVIDLSVGGPLNGLSRKDTAKPEAGVLKVLGASPETLPITLSTRGVTRRTKEVCAFPPLRVEFTQKPGPASLFRGQKGLKLVTHCQASEKYQQYVLLEYAAYRLFNALAPESFRVRLANIDYVDEGGRTIIARQGFFIEDIDDVAGRNGKQRLRGVNRISSAQIDPAAAARFAVFQDLISNLDWAMTSALPGEDCCHNSRLIGMKGTTTGLITVPYDFDYSGLVNAPYAVPPAIVPVANVRTRRYRGYCQHNEQARAFMASLAPRRAALMAIVDSTPQLSQDSRKRIDPYLGEFFDKISTPSGIADVLSTCLR
jgi:hypothetical protein